MDWVDLYRVIQAGQRPAQGFGVNPENGLPRQAGNMGPGGPPPLLGGRPPELPDQSLALQYPQEYRQLMADADPGWPVNPDVGSDRHYASDNPQLGPLGRAPQQSVTTGPNSAWAFGLPGADWMTMLLQDQLMRRWFNQAALDPANLQRT